MRLLRRPRIALLFAGAALNEIGSWASLIAFWGYAAYRFHSGPWQIAIVSIMWSAPGAVFGLVSGWPIDRFGPKRVMIVADGCGIAIALGMVWAGTYGDLVALVLGSGTVAAFGRPAANSLPPRLVGDEELLACNALLGMTTQLAIVVGPVVASVAISLWNTRAAFVVDAATFLVGLLTLLPLRLSPLVTGPGEPSAAPDVLAGVRLSWRLPELRRTMLLGLAVFCSWGASMVMEPLYVRDVLHRSSATFGWLQTIFGVGLISITALLPRLGERVVSRRAQAATVMATGAAAAMYLGSGSLAGAAVGVFAWGVVTGLFLPPFYTLLQRWTPPDSHGRVMAAAGAANGLAGLVATPLAGLAVAGVGIRPTILVIGAVLVAVGLASYLPVRPEANKESRAAASTG